MRLIYPREGEIVENFDFKYFSNRASSMGHPVDKETFVITNHVPPYLTSSLVRHTCSVVRIWISFDYDIHFSCATSKDYYGHSLIFLLAFKPLIHTQETESIPVIVRTPKPKHVLFLFRKTLGPEIQNWVIKIYICQLFFFILFLL